MAPPGVFLPVQKYKNGNGEALRMTAVSNHKQSGDDAFRSGDFSRACTSYASALEALGDGEGDAATKTSILCNRSIALLKLQRTAEAVSDAAAAVAASPGAIKPRYRHACALRAHGAIGKALAVCDAALELEPDHMQLLELAQSHAGVVDLECCCTDVVLVYGASQGASRQELLDSLIGQAANSIQMAQENWGRTSWITFQLTDIYNNKGLSARPADREHHLREELYSTI